MKLLSGIAAITDLKPTHDTTSKRQPRYGKKTYIKVKQPTFSMSLLLLYILTFIRF